MKRLLPLLLIAITARPCAADDITTPDGFKISGDGVKVIQVVQSFPFTVTAPSVVGQSFRYQWDVPAGVTATGAKTKTLTVTAAPSNLTLTVSFGVVDFDKKTVDDKEFTTTVFVAGPVPTPEPPVIDPLAQSLQDAYAAETDPQKANRTAALGAWLPGAVRALHQSGQVKTAKQFIQLLHDAADLNPSIGKYASGAIPKVRDALAAWVDTQLPTDGTATTSDAFWTQAEATYDRASAAFKQVKMNGR